LTGTGHADTRRAGGRRVVVRLPLAIG